MLDKIKDLLSENYGVNRADITENAELIADLGLTSFQLVEIISELEDMFDIETDEEEVTNIVTVKDVIDIIEKKIKESE